MTPSPAAALCGCDSKSDYRPVGMPCSLPAFMHQGGVTLCPQPPLVQETEGYVLFFCFWKFSMAPHDSTPPSVYCCPWGIAVLQSCLRQPVEVWHGSSWCVPNAADGFGSGVTQKGWGGLLRSKREHSSLRRNWQLARSMTFRLQEKPCYIKC